MKCKHNKKMGCCFKKKKKMKVLERFGKGMWLLKRNSFELDVEMATLKDWA